MATYNYNNQQGSRDRKVCLLIVAPDGVIHQFDDIATSDNENVWRVLNRQHKKSGKWSYTIYEIIAPPTTSFIELRQSFEEGLYWPQTTWDQAVAWVRKQAPHTSKEQVTSFIRRKYKFVADKFDSNQASLADWNDPVAEREPILVISLYSCIGLISNTRAKIFMNGSSGSGIVDVIQRTKTVVNLLPPEYHAALAADILTWQSQNDPNIVVLPEPVVDDNNIELMIWDKVIWLLPDGRVPGKYDWRILEIFG